MIKPEDKYYKKYSDLFKKKVIETKNKSGLAWSAAKYSVPIGTIRSWERKFSKTQTFSDQRCNNHPPLTTI